MMENVIHTWDTWNIRGTMILSLFFYLLLFFIAPLRRTTRNGSIRFLVWSAYQMAIWIPRVGIGLISHKLSDESNSNHNIPRPPFEALWAAFLLVHLGGPSTITALALEDNEHWPRHLIYLVPQAASTLYVFALIIQDNIMWFSTIVMFIAGVINYLERTLALYLASLDCIRDSKLQEPNPGLNYAELTEVSTTHTIVISEPDNGVIPPPDNHLRLCYFQALEKAHEYFDTFKGFLVDFIISLRERNETRDFFRQLEAETALLVIELELKRIYEAMYTKVQAKCSVYGFSLTSLAGAAVCISTLFFVNQEGREFNIIYSVLTLAMCVSFTILNGEWTWVRRRLHNGPYLEDGYRHYVLNTASGWSGSISGHNLIRFCLKGRHQKIHESEAGWNCLLVQKIKKRSGFALLGEFANTVISKWIIPNKLIHIFRLRDTLDSFLYGSSDNLTKELWTFIFRELKQKSNFTDDLDNVKRISMARGDWILLKDPDINIPDTCKNGLMEYVMNVEYDKIVLLWHIATELCYNHDKGKNVDTEPERNQHSFRNYDYREFSKMLSDYMLYLLVMKPTMMSEVAGIGKIRFRDTCADAERFFLGRGLKPEEQKEACDQILGVNTETNPANVIGNDSKSVLFDACILAKMLIALENEHGVSKWMLLSKMWVELMSYGAINCRAYDHVKQLCKGGELITFVWLLMAHLGLKEMHLSDETSTGRADLDDGTSEEEHS